MRKMAALMLMMFILGSFAAVSAQGHYHLQTPARQMLDSENPPPPPQE